MQEKYKELSYTFNLDSHFLTFDFLSNNILYMCVYMYSHTYMYAYTEARICVHTCTHFLYIYTLFTCVYTYALYMYTWTHNLSIHLYSSGIMALYSLISQHVFPRVILMYNHSTTIVVKKLNIHTRSLSNLQSMFKFYQLAQ